MAFGPADSRINRTGRPKESTAFKRLARNAVDQYVLKAWVNEVMTAGPQWVKCSEFLAGYAYGKPSQSIEILGDEDETGTQPRLTVEELKANARFQLEKERTRMLEATNNDNSNDH